MKKYIVEIIFSCAVVAMMGSVAGIFGAIIFESMKVLFIGLGIMFLFFVLMVSLMMYDSMFNQ